MKEVSVEEVSVEEESDGDVLLRQAESVEDSVQESGCVLRLHNGEA